MTNWTADYFKSYPLAEKPWQAIIANDGRVASNNTHFDTYFVECGYPLSGGYSYAPRFLYYALAAMAIITWRKTWIAATILASVMTYSATAAVHAVVLVSFRKRLVENPFEWISVDMSGDLILPAWPQAWDNDCDAVLAVIGVAILALIPLQIQSQIFNHPQPEVKAILLLWAMLLLTGFACALVNEEYVGAWNFPQLRLCPHGYSDSLPVSSTGPHAVNQSWNNTIWELYGHSPSNSAHAFCLYPCFNTEWPLRDNSEIIVIPQSKTTIVESMAFWITDMAVYTLVSITGAIGIMVFFIPTLDNSDSERSGLKRKVSEFLKARPFFQRSTGCLLSRVIQHIYRQCLRTYARLFCPVALVLFIVWIEITLSTDVEGESIRHVGQWGALVAAALAIAAAIIARHYSACMLVMRCRG
jgi:hypothetical protein